MVKEKLVKQYKTKFVSVGIDKPSEPCVLNGSKYSILLNEYLVNTVHIMFSTMYANKVLSTTKEIQERVQQLMGTLSPQVCKDHPMLEEITGYFEQKPEQSEAFLVFQLVNGFRFKGSLQEYEHETEFLIPLNMIVEESIVPKQEEIAVQEPKRYVIDPSKIVTTPAQINLDEVQVIEVPGVFVQEGEIENAD